MRAGIGRSSLAVLLVAAGCAGPEQGTLADWRGRTALISEAEERAPPPLPPAPPATVRAFPLYFHERTPLREATEVLWPFFETGRSSESRYFRLLPFLSRGRFRDRESTVVFPVYWRFLERREAGERRALHVWPLYGVGRREIDLAPATTHHVLYPLLSLRQGAGRFRAQLWPLASLSSGFLDRGWWLVPLFRAGAGRGGWAGGNRFLYLLDPLLVYERFSIAGGTRPESPEDVRTEVVLLGGLLGWERSGGRTVFRLFWLRI